MTSCAKLAIDWHRAMLGLMEKLSDRHEIGRADYEIHQAAWRGIALEIRHCPSWYRGGSIASQHIEIISENRQPLPITETGYRSLFLNGVDPLADFGGDPVAYALRWLDEVAGMTRWKLKEQLDLF